VTDLARGTAPHDVNEVAHVTRGARRWSGREEQSEEGRTRGKRGGEELGICFTVKPAPGDKAITCQMVWKLGCGQKMMGDISSLGLVETRPHWHGQIDGIHSQLQYPTHACMGNLATLGGPRPK
jgi:hypothetical protein